MRSYQKTFPFSSLSVLLLALLIPVSLFSLDKLSSTMAGLKPGAVTYRSVWQSDMPDGKGGRLTMNVSIERTPLSAFVRNDACQQNMVFDENGNATAETNRFFGKLVEAAGFDLQTVQMTPDGKKFVMETWKSGVRTDRKEAAVSKDQILMNSFPYVMEALLARGLSSGFSCDIMLENGLTASAEVRLVENPEFLSLSKNYSFPGPFLKRAMEVSEECGGLTVLDLNFSGIVGMVFPHHFYFAFSRKADRNFVAYYGNEPTKNASYNVRLSAR